MKYDFGRSRLCSFGSLFGHVYFGCKQRKEFGIDYTGNRYNMLNTLKLPISCIEVDLYNVSCPPDFIPVVPEHASTMVFLHVVVP